MSTDRGTDEHNPDWLPGWYYFTGSPPWKVAVADVRAAAMDSGHIRILMLGENFAVPLVVHMHGTLLPADQPAREISRPAYMLAAQTPVYEALARMHGSSVQMAVVVDGDAIRGIVTLADILKHVLPAGIAAVQAPILSRVA